MPDYTKLYRSITSDRDFRQIDRNAQHLYFWLLVSPSLNYAGICDWRPARLTGLWPGAEVEDIEASAEVLRQGRFLLTDSGTEEALFRTYVKHDGALKQKNLGASTARDYHGIASDTLRCVLRWELHKLRAQRPELAGWASLTDVLSEPAMDPDEDPGIDPKVYPQRQNREGQIRKIDPPATTTTTSTSTSTSRNRDPARQVGQLSKARNKTVLPSGFKANGKHLEQAKGLGVDPTVEIERFCDYHLSKGSKFVDWDAAFRNWLRKAAEFQASTRGRTPAAPDLPHWSQIEEPPDDLTDDQINKWYADRQQSGLVR